MKFCPECASALELKCIGGIDRKACLSPECSFVHWDNPVPVVAALVQYQGKFILARNAQWPDGMFSLVTGFLERNETPQDAVAREVKEEIGLDTESHELIGCYSLIENNQIILAHAVMATGELKIGSEISEVKLLVPDELERWQFGRLSLTAEIVNQWLRTYVMRRSIAFGGFHE